MLYLYFKLEPSVNRHWEFKHQELTMADGLNAVFVLAVWFPRNLTFIASNLMLKSGIVCAEKKLKAPQRKLVLCCKTQTGGILVLLSHSPGGNTEGTRYKGNSCSWKDAKQQSPSGQTT